MVLEWADPTLDELEAIRDYIGKDSPYYAKRFIQRIFDAAEKLQDHSHIGRQVSEANRDDVRELIFSGLPDYLSDKAPPCAGPCRHPWQPSSGGQRREPLGCGLSNKTRNRET
jgi:plasmid stabilization system protein ParE